MANTNQTKRNRIIAVILLSAALFVAVERRASFSAQTAQAFEGLAARIIREDDYFGIRPKGEVRGGVIIFPKDREDPLDYLPMLRKLAQNNLEVRVATYPLGLSALSKAGSKTLIGDGNQLPWVSLGLGSGAKKACSLADKSEEVSGLILVGTCSGEVNLNDNDLQVTFFELDSEPVPESSLENIKSKLPADTVYLRVAAEEEVMGNLAARGDEKTLQLAPRLSHEIERMLASKLVSPRNRK